MTPTEEQLYRNRLAARALSLALEGVGLGPSLVVHPSPDDPAEVRPGVEPGEVLFGDLCSPSASVYLDGARARVIVEHLDDVTAPSHRGEFDPEELGLRPAPGQPDLDAEVDLSGVVEAEGDLLRTAPRRRPPPVARQRRIRVIGRRDRP